MSVLTVSNAATLSMAVGVLTKDRRENDVVQELEQKRAIKTSAPSEDRRLYLLRGEDRSLGPPDSGRKSLARLNWHENTSRRWRKPREASARPVSPAASAPCGCFAGSRARCFWGGPPPPPNTSGVGCKREVAGPLISFCWRDSAGRFVMMGRQTGDQGQLFYLFNLERRIPERHLVATDQSGGYPDTGGAS